MRKVILILGLVSVVFSSCNCNCENRMNVLHLLLFSLQTTPIPVDLPKSIEYSEPEASLEVGIISKDNYYINQEGNTYTADEVIGILTEVAEKDSIQSIKFSVDKDATYESVFELIGFCKENDLKVILKYKNVN